MIPVETSQDQFRDKRQLIFLHGSAIMSTYRKIRHPHHASQRAHISSRFYLLLTSGQCTDCQVTSKWIVTYWFHRGNIYILIRWCMDFIYLFHACRYCTYIKSHYSFWAPTKFHVRIFTVQRRISFAKNCFNGKQHTLPFPFITYSHNLCAQNRKTIISCVSYVNRSIAKPTHTTHMHGVGSFNVLMFDRRQWRLK